MSNLLKYNYIKNVGQEKRVINSNERIRAKIKEVSGDSEQEFVSGLVAQSVEAEEVNLDLEEYNKMARSILEDAKNKSDKLLNDTYAKVAHIKEEASQQGHAEGFKKGYDEGLAKAKEAEQKAELHRQELERQYEQQIKDIEPKLVDTISTVFEKVFSIQFSDKKDIVLNIVRNAIEKIENSKEFTIKVPAENLQFVIEHKDELQEKVGQYVKIEIISDNTLHNSQCIIDTDSGVFDCSLDIQLDNLVKDLKSLSITGV